MQRHGVNSLCGALLSLAAAAGFMAVPAKAEVYYPWCAQYGGGSHGINSTVCSFATHAQCMATVRGLGGFCSPNAPPSPIRSRDRERHR